MDSILEKIQFLIDKQKGLGIPMQVIGRYCGCHPTTIKYYLQGATLGPAAKQKFEDGIKKLQHDFYNVMG